MLDAPMVDNVDRTVMQINPEFIQIASALDHERKLGKIRGPLHGIPFLVKDVSLRQQIPSRSY